MLALTEKTVCLGFTWLRTFNNNSPEIFAEPSLKILLGVGLQISTQNIGLAFARKSKKNVKSITFEKLNLIRIKRILNI